MNIGTVLKGHLAVVWRMNSFNDPIKKQPIKLNRDFSKEEVQMAKKHMKKYGQHPWP
jgi:hypothetical protein